MKKSSSRGPVAVDKKAMLTIIAIHYLELIHLYATKDFDTGKLNYEGMDVSDLERGGVHTFLSGTKDI